MNVEKTRHNSTGGIHDMYEQGSSLIMEGMHFFGLLLLFGKKSGGGRDGSLAISGREKAPPIAGYFPTGSYIFKCWKVRRCCALLFC